MTDKDFRAGSIQPSTAQLTRVSQLGATARWNRFGTPQADQVGRWLATGLAGTPDAAARNWIRTNRTLFRLTDSDVTSLELVASNPIGAAYETETDVFARTRTPF